MYICNECEGKFYKAYLEYNREGGFVEDAFCPLCGSSDFDLESDKEDGEDNDN